MPLNIKIGLSVQDVDRAINQLEQYKRKLTNKAEAICNALAETGWTVAAGILNGHVYTGDTLASLEVVQVGPTRFHLIAESTAIMFVEFGAGIRGVGHPKAEELGMGAGTYPGQRHAFDPAGWWFETDDPALAVKTTKDGKMYGHSRGNPPRMPMYTASVEMRNNLERVAKEVFALD